jgi:Protein of unknown function (DUF3431)
MEPSLEIVVARYNENLHFIQYDPFGQFPIWVYNKGTNLKFYKTDNMTIKSLPNVGREGHTYLHHIITHYDCLPEVTVFLPGSADFHLKWEKSSMVLFEAMEKMKTIIIHDMEVEHICDILADFSMNNHPSQNPINRNENQIVDLEPSALRPFGVWYHTWFPDIPCRYIVHNGVLAIHRDHIRQRPKEFYQDFIEQLSTSSNPEVGHYVERAWCALFYPLDGAHIIDKRRM